MSYLQRGLVIVGDEACGKTSLLLAEGRGESPLGPGQLLTPKVLDSRFHPMDIEVDKCCIEMSAVDTNDWKEDSRFTLAFLDRRVDVILICFSVDAHSSLDNVGTKWLPKCQHMLGSQTPFLLVATKLDLWTDAATLARLAEEKLQPVRYEEGKAAADKLGAYAYLECSAKTREGVHEVFITATKATLSERNPRKGCTLL